MLSRISAREGFGPRAHSAVGQQRVLRNLRRRCGPIKRGHTAGFIDRRNNARGAASCLQRPACIGQWRRAIQISIVVFVLFSVGVRAQCQREREGKKPDGPSHAFHSKPIMWKDKPTREWPGISRELRLNVCQPIPYPKPAPNAAPPLGIRPLRPQEYHNPNGLQRSCSIPFIRPQWAWRIPVRGNVASLVGFSKFCIAGKPRPHWAWHGLAFWSAPTPMGSADPCMQVCAAARAG